MIRRSALIGVFVAFLIFFVTTVNLGSSDDFIVGGIFSFVIVLMGYIIGDIMGGI